MWGNQLGSWQGWEVICTGWWCEQCLLSSICRKEETFVWASACIHVCMWAAVASQLLNSGWCGEHLGEQPPLHKTPTSHTPVHRESERPRTWHTALIALSVFCVKISPKPAPLSWTVNLPQNGLALNLINMGGFFFWIPYTRAVLCYNENICCIIRILIWAAFSELLSFPASQCGSPKSFWLHYNKVYILNPEVKSFIPTGENFLH